MRNNQPVVDREYRLRDDQYLISRTDLQGRIQYANPAFIEVSGFESAELIGEHHNVVRHPDMPRAAFADLWATLKAGKTWVGYVKNRRKDGCYYWVLATVSPIYRGDEVIGFGSVRVKAPADTIQRIGENYRQFNAGELPHHGIRNGQVQALGWRAWPSRLALWRVNTLAARLAWLSGSALVGVIAMAAVGIHAAGLPPAESGWAAPVLIGMALTGTAWLAWLGASLARSVWRPLQQALRFSRQIGAGNVEGVRIEPARGEVGELMFALEIMRKSLLSIAHDMNGSVTDVVSGADRIARGNADLAVRTQQQAAALDRTAASMEQFAESVAQNAANARQASRLAASATQTAGRGSDVVQQAVDRMRLISATSHKITDIIGVIDDIAFQTNILALNAAVEAARAGSQGRGFAVVAGEVRALAQKSAQAAKEIKALIEQSGSEIDSGASLVAQSGNAMSEVVSAIERVSVLMGEIATASQQQASGIEDVKNAVQQMDDVTQRNAALVEEAASAAETLRDRSAYLGQAASVFMVDSKAGKSAQVSATVPARRDGTEESRRRLH